MRDAWRGWQMSAEGGWEVDGEREEREGYDGARETGKKVG